MRKRVIGIVGALLLATVGTLVLVGYVQAARNKALAEERLVDVLVVQEPVPKGTAAADLEPKVRTEQVPARLRAQDAVSDLDAIKDLHTTVELVPGEQLVKGRFATAGEAARGDVPDGLLEVTVPLEPARALGGRVRAGDTVGVLLSFDPFDVTGVDPRTGAAVPAGIKTPNSTHLELHKVLITGVQQEQQAGAVVGKKDAGEGEEQLDTAPSGKLLVTLAVDARSVEKVVFAAEHGFVWLSAEPHDAPEDGTKVVTRGNVHDVEGGAL